MVAVITGRRVHWDLSIQSREIFNCLCNTRADSRSPCGRFGFMGRVVESRVQWECLQSAPKLTCNWRTASNQFYLINIPGESYGFIYSQSLVLEFLHLEGIIYCEHKIYPPLFTTKRNNRLRMSIAAAVYRLNLTLNFCLIKNTLKVGLDQAVFYFSGVNWSLRII